MRKIFFPILLITLLTGCAANMRVDSATAQPEKGEAIIVMGVKPDQALPAIFRGVEKAGTFTRKTEFGSNPAKLTDGYQVFRVPSGELYGVTQISMTFGLLRSDYLVCDGALATTFRPNDGEVLYLGHFSFKREASKLGMRISNEMGAVTAFMNQNYPKLGGKIKTAQLSRMPSMESCSQFFAMSLGKSGGMLFIETGPDK